MMRNKNYFIFNKNYFIFKNQLGLFVNKNEEDEKLIDELIHIMHE